MTTTTEIATLEPLEAEIVEPLNKTDAKRLDKKIRSSNDRLNNYGAKMEDEFAVLAKLLDEAAEGQIHKALGLKSWTAYVKDAVQFRPSNREERKAVVAMMSGKLLSQRTIADVLGISQKTVDRDLDGEEFESDTIETVDGKTAPRNKPPKDVEPEDEPPAHQTSVTEDFRDEVYQLQNNVQAFKDVLDDERFPKARARLAKSKAVNDFRSAIDELEDLLVIIVGVIIVGEEDTAPEADE